MKTRDQRPVSNIPSRKSSLPRDRIIRLKPREKGQTGMSDANLRVNR